MRKYIVKLYPERRLGKFHITIRHTNKTLFFVFFLYTILVFIFCGVIPLISSGLSFSVGFSFVTNFILIFYYFWVSVDIKKNDIGNGVPEEW